MSDETTTETPVQEPAAGAEAEAAKTESSAILDELSKLGHKASTAVQQLWESDERKKAEEEIRKALRMAGDRIDQVVADVRTSETTAEIKDQATKLVDTVEKSKVTEDIRRGLLAGLRKLNTELTEFLERDKGASGEATEKAGEAAPAQAETTEKAPE